MEAENFNDDHEKGVEKPAETESSSAPRERRTLKKETIIGLIAGVAVLAALFLAAFLAPGRKDANENASAMDLGSSPTESPTPSPVKSDDPTLDPTRSPTLMPTSPTSQPTTGLPSAQPSAYFYETDGTALLNFLMTLSDRDFYMVNIVRHREMAVYLDGRETNLTGSQADQIYTEFVATEMFPMTGAELVFSGTIEREDGQPSIWETIGIVRYPNMSAFTDMVSNPIFQAMLAHKQAGIQDTIILATERMNITTLPINPNPRFPPNQGDLSLSQLHLLDFNDLTTVAGMNVTGKEAFGTYAAAAEEVGSLTVDAQLIASFKVGAVLAGPRGGWEEVRLVFYPSHTAYDTLTSDPDWQSLLPQRAAALQKSQVFQASPILSNSLQ